MSKQQQQVTTAQAQRAELTDEAEIRRAVERWADMRNQKELADMRVVELEKMLAVAESRAERAEHDVELLKSQRDDTLSRLVEVTTIVQTIGASIDSARVGVLKTVRKLRENGSARDITPMPAL